MAVKYVDVKAPSANVQLALSRRGGDFTLVFDGKTQEWKIIKKSDISKYNQPHFVTLSSYQGGQTTAKITDGTTPSTKPGGQTKPYTPGYSGKASDTAVTENAVNTAVITFEGGQPIVTFTVPNPANPKGDPVTYQSYLYVDDKGGVSLSPDDARAGIVAGKEFAFDKKDAARDKHLNDLYKKFGSKQAIIDRLYNAGYLNTNKNVPTDAMLAALDSAAAQYTVDQVEGYKSKQIKEFITLAEWLGQRQNNAPESLAGTRTSTNITEFSDTDARALIDDVAQGLLQRLPTDEEYAKLVPLVQQKQRKNPAITATTTDEKGRVVATKTKTGINERQFLIERLSKGDEAKANQIMGYYDAFKQAIGVR